MLKQNALRFALFLMLLCPLVGAEDDPYLISLGKTTLSPPVGLIEIEQPGHFLMQFYDIPSESQIEDLASIGIEIQRYVGGNAYIAASSKTLSFTNLARFNIIRAIFLITPDMRQKTWV